MFLRESFGNRLRLRFLEIVMRELSRRIIEEEII